jgi:phosphohistidine phosphatase SixA
MRLLPYLLLFLVVGCSTDRSRERADTQTIVLVRHAEKCEMQGDDPALSPAGEARAADLARVVGRLGVDRIYSTPFKRTRDTVRPLADSLGLPIVEAPVGAGNVEALRDLLLADTSRVILVSGHSNTVPHVVNWLTGTALGDLGEYEYDRMYVVRLPDEEPGALLEFQYGAPSSRTPGC